MSARLFNNEVSKVTPAGFARLVERFLWHSRFLNVSNVDGSGDGGADLVGALDGEVWVIQAKWKASTLVDHDAVGELVAGMQKYNAKRGAVATTVGFTRRAKERVELLRREAGLQIFLWTGPVMESGLELETSLNRFGSPILRPYQIDAFQAIQSDLKANGKSLLILATGLGKTVIAGNVIDAFLAGDPFKKVLVLAHTRELVEQLERGLWRCLPRSVPTQQIKGDEKPDELFGVSVATVQSAIAYVRGGFVPDLIVVDEAHHAGADGQFAEIFDLLEDVPRLGVTATPWRGDAFDVAHHFGLPSYKLGIEEGMRLGYLADVRYQLFCDNIDWDFVKSHSENDYSIRELNSKLFIPQKDEGIRDLLISAWNATVNPRAIVFCQSIEHAKRMTSMLKAVPFWAGSDLIHNKLSATEQKMSLAKFRLGQIPILVAVDMLNEGVDVPDVNLICFARVTHSRRIFVQQLGRGLRLSPGKDHVTVLDFVSDLRRVAATLNLQQQISGDVEELHLGASHTVEFMSQESESFFAEWINDAASLETQADEYRLNFPAYS